MENKIISQIEQDAQKSLVFGAETTPQERIGVLKEFWDKERKHLRQKHLGGLSGRKTTQAQSHITDIMIRHLYENAKAAYEAEHGRWPYPTSIIAIGGYGREELSPFSDIDIMLLHPQKIKPELLEIFLKKFNEMVIHPLWDLKLKVGNSCRTISQTIQEAKVDFRTQNTQLDTRLLCGSAKFYKLFRENYIIFYGKENHQAFTENCLRELTIRHQRHENTVFLQEPDIKNGVGGLRDVLTMLWIARAGLKITTIEGLHKAKYLSQRESSQLQIAYDFLIRVRNELHFQSTHPTNLLHLEKQSQVALGLGYKAEDMFALVEEFMKDYYKHAQNIYRISTQVITRIMELDKRVHSKFSLSKVLKGYRNKPQKRIDGFVMRGNEFTYEHEDVFIENPVRMIRVFRHCQQFNAKLDSKLKALIGESLELITPKVIQDPAANKSFRSIFQSVGEVYPTLSLMHEIGVLGQFLPEFKKLRGLVQHEYYHRYTADIHTLKTIGELDDIFTGKSADNLKYLEALRETTRPSLLYLMLLLHDLGKAERNKSHLDAGAQLAKPILDRLDINPKQQELVLSTIENHLEMTRYWQHFDVEDPTTATALAKSLGDIELLHYLYVLTYCDTKGTAPGLWNDYKDMLHSQLYKNTYEHFGNRKDFLEERKLRKKLIYKDLLKLYHPEFTEDQVEAQLNLHPERYFVLSTPEEMKLHIEMLDQLHSLIFKSDCSGSLMPIIHWENDIDQSLTIVTIVTWDRTGLFFNLAGAFAASGLNILSTKAITRADKITIDTFYVVEAPDSTYQGQDLKKIFEKKAEDILVKDKDPMIEILAQAKRQFKRVPLTDEDQRRVAAIPTKINVYHELLLKRTIVEIQSADQIGLLYTVAQAISKHGFDITFARISTEHGVALDTFYIQKNNIDETTGTTDLIALREYLNDVLTRGRIPTLA